MEKEEKRLKSIRTRLIGLVVLAILIPTALATSGSYFYVRHQNIEEAERSSLSTLSRGSVQISHYMEDIGRLPTSLYANRSLMNVMEAGVGRQIEEAEGTVSRALLGMFLSRQDIEQLHFVILKGRSEYSVYHMKTSSRGEFDWWNETDYFNLLQMEERVLIEPAHEIRAYNKQTLLIEEEEVVSFRYRIDKVENGTPLGFLSVDVPSSVFKQQLRLLESSPDEKLWLYAQDRLIAKTTAEDFSGKMNMTEESGSFRLGTSFVVYDKTRINGLPITLVKQIPYASIIKSANETAVILLLIALASLVLMIIAASIVALKITQPLKALTASVWRVEQGDLSAPFVATTNDEIGLLARQFNQMVERVDLLIKREYRLALENKTNELRALQSQMNPHFLFNALQSIGTTTLQGERKVAYRLITGLSQMMRYSMNNQQTIVSLKQDIDHLQAYMRLQQQRFPRQFRYIVDIPWNLNEIQIPKMILQPLAENYFKHAFRQQDGAEENYLAFKVRHDGDMLMIQVENSGTFIPEDVMESLRIQMTEPRLLTDGRTTGIGLHNIYERLSIFYSGEARMAIQSPGNGGFRIVIRIPIKEEMG